VSNPKKTISIIQTNLTKFMQNPKELFQKLMMDSVGRANIDIGEKRFYLMTRERFDFFVKYELKKEKLLFENKLADCQESNPNKQRKFSFDQLTQAQKSLLKIKDRFEMLKNLSDDEILTIMNDIIITQYNKGEKVFTAGTTGKEIYFIVRGAVTVHVGPQNKQVAVLQQGHFFGEMAYILREPRTATIIAATSPCLLLSFKVNEKNNKRGSEKSFMKFYKNVNNMLAKKIKIDNQKH
jgi:hypothetical protein